MDEEPFSDEEISDYDQEEAAINSEEDYEAEDDYVLNHRSVVRHHPENFTYEDGWSEKPPRAIPDEFEFDPPNIPPIEFTAEQGFLSFMSPGIINKYIF